MLGHHLTYTVEALGTQEFFGYKRMIFDGPDAFHLAYVMEQRCPIHKVKVYFMAGCIKPASDNKGHTSHHERMTKYMIRHTTCFDDPPRFII